VAYELYPDQVSAHFSHHIFSIFIIQHLPFFSCSAPYTMLFSQSILIVAALAAINSAAPTAANGAAQISNSPPSFSLTLSPLIFHTGEVKRNTAYYYGKAADAVGEAPKKRGYYYYGKKEDAETSTEKRDPGYYYYGKKADAETSTEKRDPGYYYYGKAADAETEEKREADAKGPVE
jgi:hypothetical protein